MLQGERTRSTGLLDVVQGLHLTRALRLLGGRRAPAESQGDAVMDRSEEDYDDPELLSRVIERYLGNKRLEEAVAATHGVRVAHVWQPVPTLRRYGGWPSGTAASPSQMQSLRSCRTGRSGSPTRPRRSRSFPGATGRT